MKSPIVYYGGKYALAEIIEFYAPVKRDTYVETFFGGGSVFFYLNKWAEIEILNDLNGDVVNFFRVLRDQPNALINRLQLTPSARQEIRESTQIIEKSKDKVTRALYFFVRANQSFSGNMRANGGWHSNKDKDCAQEWKNKCSPSVLYRVSERLLKASLENMPAIKVLRRYDDKKTFVYHDPPYLSVFSAKDKAASYQGFDMQEEQHKEFIEACLPAKSMQIISGYDHPLYNKLVAYGWKKIEIQYTTSAGNGANQKVNNQRTEILWISPNCKNIQPSLFGT